MRDTVTTAMTSVPTKKRGHPPEATTNPPPSKKAYQFTGGGNPSHRESTDPTGQHARRSTERIQPILHSTSDERTDHAGSSQQESAILPDPSGFIGDYFNDSLDFNFNLEPHGTSMFAFYGVVNGAKTSERGWVSGSALTTGNAVGDVNIPWSKLVAESETISDDGCPEFKLNGRKLYLAPRSRQEIPICTQAMLQTALCDMAPGTIYVTTAPITRADHTSPEPTTSPVLSRHETHLLDARPLPKTPQQSSSIGQAANAAPQSRETRPTATNTSTKKTKGRAADVSPRQPQALTPKTDSIDRQCPMDTSAAQRRAEDVFLLHSGHNYTHGDSTEVRLPPAVGLGQDAKVPFNQLVKATELVHSARDAQGGVLLVSEPGSLDPTTFLFAWHLNYSAVKKSNNPTSDCAFPPMSDDLVLGMLPRPGATFVRTTQAGAKAIAEAFVALYQQSPLHKERGGKDNSWGPKLVLLGPGAPEVARAMKGKGADVCDHMTAKDWTEVNRHPDWGSKTKRKAFSEPVISTEHKTSWEADSYEGIRGVTTTSTPAPTSTRFLIVSTATAWRTIVGPHWTAADEKGKTFQALDKRRGEAREKGNPSREDWFSTQMQLQKDKWFLHEAGKKDGAHPMQACRMTKSASEKRTKWVVDIGHAAWIWIDDMATAKAESLSYQQVCGFLSTLHPQAQAPAIIGETDRGAVDSKAAEPQFSLRILWPRQSESGTAGTGQTTPDPIGPRENGINTVLRVYGCHPQTDITSAVGAGAGQEVVDLTADD